MAKALFVLELAALVLAGDHDARGEVRDAHGRVGGVDALAAVTGRVVHVNAQVVGVNLDLNVIRQDGEHLNAGKGGLTALLRVGGRDANEAMDTLLGAEHPVGVLPAHGERRAVKPDGLAGHGVVDGDLPASAVAVALVHAEEHLAPVLRLETALSRGDGHDGVAVVELVSEPARELELREVLLQGGGELGRLGEKVAVPGLAAQVVRGDGVVELRPSRLHAGDVVPGGGELSHHRPGALGVIPEAGLGASRLELGDLVPLLVETQVALDLLEPRGEGLEVRLGDVGH